MIYVPTRNELGALLKPGAICAEIGVCKAWYSLEILKWPVAKLYLIDSWTPLGPEYHDPLSNTDHEANRQESLLNLSGHMPGGRVQIVRASSLAAVTFYDIPPLDFCFIDAAHDYESVLADLRAWSAKMKPDGLLCGHDFTRCPMAQQYGWGVIEAVETFCSETDWRMTHVTDEEFASFVLQRK